VKTLRLIACFIGLAVLVALGSPRAQAQAEIDPDHYEIGDPQRLCHNPRRSPLVKFWGSSRQNALRIIFEFSLFPAMCSRAT
jgi:hypothetical protein